jgi:hypothetical protein
VIPLYFVVAVAYTVVGSIRRQNAAGDDKA